MTGKIIFSKAKYLILTLALVTLSGCNEDGETPVDLESSFLPMQIGNYWKIDESNWTEITDTLTIEGNLYYKFFSLIGGDALRTEYLRIDENEQLVQALPDTPGFQYKHARFNIPVGDTFFTLDNQTINDYKVTLIESTDSTRVFEFELVYHPNFTSRHTVAYVKGLGKIWGTENPYKEVKINGEVYNF